MVFNTGIASLTTCLSVYSLCLCGASPEAIFFFGGTELTMLPLNGRYWSTRGSTDGGEGMREITGDTFVRVVIMSCAHIHACMRAFMYACVMKKRVKLRCKSFPSVPACADHTCHYLDE